MKIFNKIIVGLMIALNLLNIAFWGIMLHPFRVVDINTVEVLNTEPISPGDQVEIRVTGTKHFDVPGKIQRKLVNHYEYVLAPEIVHNILDPGDFDIVVKVPIPSYVDGDVYHIHTDMEHKIFGIRTIHSHWETPVFIVKE